MDSSISSIFVFLSAAFSGYIIATKTSNKFCKIAIRCALGVCVLLTLPWLKDSTMEWRVNNLSALATSNEKNAVQFRVEMDKIVAEVNSFK